MGRRAFLRLASGAGVCAFAWPVLSACGASEAGTQRQQVGSLPTIRDKAPPKQPRRGQLRLGATPQTVGDLLLPLISAQLCVVDPRSGEVHGDLAERVEFAGDLRVAFALRADARFHAGTDGLAQALTSDSVQHDFAMRAAAREFLFTEVVQKVEAPDPRTVVLQLKAPFATLFEALGDPLQASIRGAGKYEKLNLPLGAGPFIPALVEQGTVLLGANQLYHRPGLPLVEAISVQIRPDHAALEALAAGGGLDVHRSTVGQEPPRSLGMKRAIRPGRGMFGIAMSVATIQRGDRKGAPGVFQDERARRAVALSLDRVNILSEWHALESGPVGPAFGSDALKPDELQRHAIYQRQPQAAVGLLAAASQAELAFSMLAPDTVDARALVTAVQKQVAEAGMRLRPVLTPQSEWETALRAGDFEAVLFDSGDLRTPDAALRLHTSSGLEGTFSPWGYSNPVYDAQVRHALSAIAPSERGARAQAAQRVLLDSVPALLPIGSRIEEAWVSSSLLGYEWEANSLNESSLAATWRLVEPGRKS